MKIDAKKFRGYISKVTMNAVIDMVVLNFTAEGVVVRAKTLDNTSAGFGLLKTNAFQGYEAIGEIGIKNVKTLIDMLKTMTGVIDLVLQGNKFVLSNEKQLWSLTTASKDYIANHLEQEMAAPFDGGVNINPAVLKTAMGNKTIVAGDIMVLECINKVISLSTISSDSTNASSVKEVCDYKDFKSKFGAALDSAIAVLDTTVNMACADSYPIRFIESTEDYIVKLLVAPMDEEKVEDVKPEVETPVPVAPVPSVPIPAPEAIPTPEVVQPTTV